MARRRYVGSKPASRAGLPSGSSAILVRMAALMSNPCFHAVDAGAEGNAPASLRAVSAAARQR